MEQKINPSVTTAGGGSDITSGGVSQPPKHSQEAQIK